MWLGSLLVAYFKKLKREYKVQASPVRNDSGRFLLCEFPMNINIFIIQFYVTYQ